jgi:hypothetical protein
MNENFKPENTFLNENENSNIQILNEYLKGLYHCKY